MKERFACNLRIDPRDNYRKSRLLSSCHRERGRKVINNPLIPNRQQQIIIELSETTIRFVMFWSARVCFEDCLPHQEFLLIFAAHSETKKRVRAAGSRKNIFANAPTAPILSAFSGSTFGAEKVDEYYQFRGCNPLPHIAAQARSAEIFNCQIGTRVGRTWGRERRRLPLLRSASSFPQRSRRCPEALGHDLLWRGIFAL